MKSLNEAGVQGLTMKRGLLTAALSTSILSAGLLPTQAAAQDTAANYPNRPIRFVIPYPPGGATDIIGRSVSNKAGEFLGQNILVDNRPGANTIIGAEIVARSQPDGYSLLFATLSTMVLNRATYKKLPYDPIKDFAPVAKLSEYPYYVVQRLGFQPKTIKELVAYAKANPGKVTYASSGNGSPAHFGGVMLEQMAGIKLVHVPYKGNAPANADMLGERLDINLTGLASIAANVKAGKMRLMAVAGHVRDPRMPDIPTVQEAGFKDYWVGTWFSVVTKSGTPRPVIVKLNREINRALKDPAVAIPMTAQGYDLAQGTPEDLGNLIKKEIPRWTAAAKAGNISFD
jgi:tripartite-type tricarboxylate transporter receptor subunit TctC